MGSAVQKSDRRATETLPPGSPKNYLALLPGLLLYGTGDKRVEALRIADAFRARAVDTTHTSFVFEMTGAPSKIDSFIDLMRPLGLTDVSRTGVAAITRGPEAM